MNYRQAAAFVMPLGKYQGHTLDEIARTDPGLLYLDWLRGELRCPRSNETPLDTALRLYLEDPTIAAELSKAVE